MNNQIDKEKRKSIKLGWFYRTICWCSGARLYILKQCPSDFNRFFGIGIIVIMTGLMASLSGGYALYTIFGEVWAAVLFGLVWGMMIFFLDWYIVSSLRKENKFYREFFSAMPRIILAVLIGIVISKPLELKLFEKEINQELLRMQAEKSLEYKNMVSEEFSEITALEEKNEQLDTEMKLKEIKRNQLFEMIIAEAEGNSPTQQVGKGPVYREKKAEFDKIQLEYNDLKERNLAQIATNNEQLSRLKEKRDSKLTGGESVIVESGGFLGRLNAIKRLSAEERSVRNANIFIIMLFVFIESAPMIVKLMSKRGTYDELLESIEYDKHVSVEKSMVANRIKEFDLNGYIEELNKIRAESKYDTDMQYIKDVFIAQNEVDRRKIELWKKEQLEKLERNLSDSIKSIDDLVKKDYKILPDTQG